MNDRLMIAAMAMQGMLASPDCIGDAQAVSGDASCPRQHALFSPAIRPGR